MGRLLFLRRQGNAEKRKKQQSAAGNRRRQHSARYCVILRFLSFGVLFALGAKGRRRRETRFLEKQNKAKSLFNAA